MSGPLVTIAIPTYSRLSLLKEAVDSALAQTYPHCEALISQNPGGNEDAETEQWARSMAGQNSRIRYQKNPVNIGMAGNWNASVDAAKGDYVVLLADDDRLLPQCVATMISHLNSEIVVVFSNHYIIDAQGARDVNASIKCLADYKRDRIPVGLVSGPGHWVWQNSVPIVSSLIRAEELRRLRFKEDLNTPEIEMFARIAEEGSKFWFCDEYLAEYRVHGSSATSAGLMTERLLPAMFAINVSPQTASYKALFINECARGAIAKALRKRNLLSARELLRSPYGCNAFHAESLKGMRGSFIRVIYVALLLVPKSLLSFIQRCAAGA